MRSSVRRHLGTANASAAASASGRTFAAAAAGSDGPLVKTALNGLHRELGGDMVPFAGYELPVLYKGSDNGGVMKEHLWCRSDGSAALFDVSHMGQVRTRARVCVGGGGLPIDGAPIAPPVLG